jgi:hypothetical protein
MAKTGLGGAEESTGVQSIPPQGVKFKITAVEKGKTTASEYQAAGLKQFLVEMQLTEPKKAKGISVKTWFVVGIEDDPMLKNEENWKVAKDSAHLKRLFVRTGTPIPEDDEEFADALTGAEGCAHTFITAKEFTGIKKGQYYRESDEDFVGVGEMLAVGGKVKATKAAPAKRKVDEDDEDEKPAAAAKETKKKKPADDDDDD